jgi:hypothetical protein
MRLLRPWSVLLYTCFRSGRFVALNSCSTTCCHCSGHDRPTIMEYIDSEDDSVVKLAI